MLTLPVTFSFVGMAPRTADLQRRVLEIARGEFRDEQIVDFGDPLANWDDVQIGEREKKSFSPKPRLAFRGGLLLDYLENVTVPQVAAGATLGFFRRLGADTYFGATARAEDPQTLLLWEAFIEHGVRALGLFPPLYLHTDGDDLLERRLRGYCAMPNQRYVRIEPTADIEKQAWMVIGAVCEERGKRRAAA